MDSIALADRRIKELQAAEEAQSKAAQAWRPRLRRPRRRWQRPAQLTRGHARARFVRFTSVSRPR